MHELLQDIAGQRAGQAQRFEPVSLRIAALRQEDDADLPQGEWQHSMRRADWPGVARLCEEALKEGGKDFQIAAQLCEAWLHCEGVPGLLRGADLMCGMIESFWEDGWPALDPEELEPRRAPFSWLLARLSVVVVTRIVLLTVPGETDTPVTADVLRRLDLPHEQDAEDQTPTLDIALCRRMAAAQAAQGQALLEVLQQATAAWAQVEQLLNERMAGEAPGFAPLRAALLRLERCVQTLWPLAGQEPASQQMLPAVPVVAPAPMPTLAAAVAPMAMPVTREQAYQQLQTIADYLADIEPHSPTPYVLREAIAWGDMPLDALMRSLAQEEGGLARLLALLNVS